MGRKAIPRTRRCDHCGETIARKPSAFSRGSIGPLAGLAFCGRDCQKAMFRGRAECAWPGCPEFRLVEGSNFRRKTARVWLCEGHTDRMEAITGSRKMTARKLEFLSGVSIDHNRLTWPFVKFVIFERDGGACQKCSVALHFGARPVPFHIDHAKPVWLGGKTAVDNLQLLCIACHKAKSADEQKLVNQTRWKHRVGAGFQRMTHFEKDKLIDELRSRIRALGGDAWRL